MSATYDDIPQTMRDLLEEIYDPEGVVIWWNARQKHFDGQTPAQTWESSPEGRARVQRWVDYLTGGAW